MTCTFTNTYTTTDGRPERGTVTFTPSPAQILDASAAKSITGRPVMAKLDESGTITVAVAPTDDPTLSPHGWTYEVHEDLEGRASRVYHVAAPDGATVVLARVAPIPSSAGHAIVKGDKGDKGDKGEATEGDKGDKGDKGTPGAPGGSDAATAEWIATGTATKAALDGSYAGATPTPDYTVTPFTPTIAPDAREPAWLCRDGETILWTGGPQLRYGTGATPTATNAHVFPLNSRAARECADGEVLVSTMYATDFTTRGAVWRSNGWVTNKATATFTKVLDLVAENAYVTNHWSIDARDGYVVVGEYGPHGDTPEREARRVWLSTDDGKTYTQILDIGFALKRHQHGVAIDTYEGIVWAVNGDLEGNCQIQWAPLDNPTSWTVIDNSYTHQAVGIVPMKDCVLFTSDAAPNGIMRARRRGGRTFGPIEHPYKLDDVKAYEPTCFGRLSYRRSEAHPVYMTFAASGTNPAPGVIVATMNGETFHEVWRDTPDQIKNDGGAQTALGPTNSGKLVASVFGTQRGGQFVASGPAPTWTPKTVGSRLRHQGRPVAPEAVGVRQHAWPQPGAIVTAVKPTDTSRAATVTRASDPHLRLVGMGPNSTWAIEANLIVSTTSQTPDLAYSINTDSLVPGDITGWFGSMAGLAAATSWAVTPVLTAIPLKAAQTVGLDAVSQGIIRVSGVVTIGPNQGPVAVHWAQGTSDPAAVTLKAGSWLKATRLT